MTRSFPEPPPEKGISFKIKQADLREALRLTSFAAEQNTDRYILNGCFLYFSEEGKCQVIAKRTRGGWPSTLSIRSAFPQNRTRLGFSFRTMSAQVSRNT